MRSLSFSAGSIGLLAILTIQVLPVEAASKRTPSPSAQAAEVAAQVDQLIAGELSKAGVTVAGLANDEDFLRRISFDLAGTPPAPHTITLFGLNPDPAKRAQAVDQLLVSPAYARNWASYWRDVVYMNATNMRARGGQRTFEEWLTDQFAQGRGWDQIVTEMLTATGDVSENGATALFFAHQAEPEEVAAEASRIFLGIQMQCANCHDHPSDIWKRTQFHELAAFFPRVALRPKQMDGMLRGFEVVSVGGEMLRRGGPDMLRENPEMVISRIDRNKDGKISKEEAQTGGPLARIFDRILENGDTNKDGLISAAELKNMPPPDMQPGRGAAEYYMADLNDPASKGKLIHPKFFVDQSAPGKELNDQQRRSAAAKAFTDPSNPWFARAFVNRIWHELLGEGFYMPVDDLGPTRTARFPEVLDVLAQGFAANQYDPRWLLRTITLTQTYQRQIRPKSVSGSELPFAAQTPTRLKADQLFNSIASVLGLEERTPAGPAGMMGGPYAAVRTPRGQFEAVFAFDLSTPQEDLTGNVQQSLLLMNAPGLRGAISANGNTRLGQILRKHADDQDAISEVYLLTLSREPSDQELKVTQQHLRDVNNRSEAYEDILWSLLNSSEFLSKR